MPVIFGCTLILIILIRYETKKHAGNTKETIDDFFKKELEANTTRKKDISGLPYLTACIDTLPDFSGIADPEKEVTVAFKALQALNGKPMLNLSGISNTDLKLAYGAANFPFLSECDSTFTLFTRELQHLGRALHEAGADREAAETLQYAVDLGSDIISTYRLLAFLYQSLGDTSALTALRTKAATLPDEIRQSVLPFIV